MKDEALKLAFDLAIMHHTDNGYSELRQKVRLVIKQARSAPVQSCYCPNCESMGKELAALKAQPAPVQTVDTDELTILWMLINAWRDAPAPALHICGKINSYVLALKQPTPPAQPAPAPGYCKHCKQYSIEEPLPAAQRQWVGLTPHERMMCRSYDIDTAIDKTEAKLKEKNT
jgi:hypothetical protein